MKRIVTVVLMCASAALGAEKIVVRPRVVVVVRQNNTANLVGGIIGNAIAEWMIRRQNRAIYGKQCDALFDSRCQPPAPVAVEWVPAPASTVGSTLLPGQCPGIAPCTAQ